MNWQSNFYTLSPKLFEPIYTLWKPFEEKFSNNWPTIPNFNEIKTILYQQIALSQQYQVLFIESSKELEDTLKQRWTFQGYEKLINSEKKVISRSHSYHDFFNFLTWLLFPKIKLTINRLYVEKGEETPTSSNLRTTLQNKLAVFEEGGVLLIASNESYFDLIDEHQWKEFFWEKRNQLAQEFECLVYGHGLYEKGLNPYIGMTGAGIFIKVDAAYFELNHLERILYLDERVSQQLGECIHQNNFVLHPFPFFGLPDWYIGNDKEEFYENKKYFREKSYKARIQNLKALNKGIILLG